MTERWLPIPDYEKYEISDLGNVRRLVMKTSRDSTLVKPFIGDKSKGYYLIKLSKDGKKRKFRLHNLVLKVFVGPCPDGHQGAHKDGNKAHNELSNLAWKTHAENQADKLEHGTATPNAKLKPDDILAIRASLDTQAQLAEKYGICISAICRILHRKTWRHV